MTNGVRASLHAPFFKRIVKESALVSRDKKITKRNAKNYKLFTNKYVYNGYKLLFKYLNLLFACTQKRKTIKRKIKLKNQDNFFHGIRAKYESFTYSTCAYFFTLIIHLRYRIKHHVERSPLAVSNNVKSIH